MSALYDDSVFFRNYLDLRKEAHNYNDLYEQPEIFSLLPPLEGKRVLDIGCGYGASSIKFVQMGAAQVLAIDVSQRMLDKARAENASPRIEYRQMDASDLSGLEAGWDVAFSSVAFHYLEDLDKLFHQIAQCLAPGGVLAFSMEHPIVTAAMDEARDILGKEGEPVGFFLDHYAQSGRREVTWLDTPIVKYHHTISDVVNGLIRAGLTLEVLKEPCPPAELIARVPRMRSELHRPSYLMCRARKEV